MSAYPEGGRQKAELARGWGRGQVEVELEGRRQEVRMG